MQKRLISMIIFIAYLMALIKVMVFKDIPGIHIGHLMLNFGGSYEIGSPNLIPFTTIVPYLLGNKGAIIAGANLIGNIAPLVPLGFLAPLIYPKTTWKKSLLLAVLSGLVIETLQTILHVGIFDIDDVILNALGVMLGYWAFLYISKWFQEKKYVYIVIAAVAVIVSAFVAFSAIYPWGQPLNYSRTGTDDSVSQSGTGTDLCGGTGGTGIIMSKGSNSITIKRHDGVMQTIALSTQTDIRNSIGSITASELKVGDHVTIVIMEQDRPASTVLVCAAGA